jgi:hypothetical protein
MVEPSGRENSEDALAALRQEMEQQAAALRVLRRQLRRRRDTDECLRNISHHVTLIHAHLQREEARRGARLTGWLRRRLGALRNRIRSRIQRFLTPHLGRLQQYQPRPLRIPASYTRLPSLSQPPLLSVVTPSFNQAAFLERTMKSVLDQEYPRLEYIVQDGGSTDDSVCILERYQERLAHWESARDRGQSHAINLGFRHATGDILAYLNSDDMLLPGSLHYVAHYFETHPEVDVVYGHRVVIDTDDCEIGRWVLPPHNDEILSWADYVPQETLFWRRRIWEKIGGQIDEDFQFAMDWDLLLRLRDAGARFARVPRFLAAFRVHTQQKTSAKIEDIGLKEMKRLRERAVGRPVSGEEINARILPFLRKHIFFHKLYRAGVVRY